MSPDTHVVFTKFEQTKTPTVVTYGEQAILKQVRTYVAGHEDALRRLADVTHKFLTCPPREACKHVEEMRAAEEHARRILGDVP